MPAARRVMTTFLGVSAIALGLLGVALVCATHGTTVILQPAATVSFENEMALSLTAKCLLVCVGVLVLRRSRWALFFTFLLLVASTADSVLTLGWLLPPVPPNLTAAGRMGRAVGRGSGAVVPFILYLLLIVYLLLPRTRAEFKSQPHALEAPIPLPPLS